MQLTKLSRDKLFNIATIFSIIGVIIISNILELKAIGDVASLVIFFSLSAFNKVTFKDDMFFNSQSDDLSNNLPTKFAEWTAIVVLIAFICIATNLISLGYNLFASIFTIIISYFLFKNCPIAILINEEAWQRRELIFGIKPPANYQESNLFKGSSVQSYTHIHSSSAQLFSSNTKSINTTTDFAYRHLPHNIYNNK
jgi:hypothetical protein